MNSTSEIRKYQFPAATCLLLSLQLSLQLISPSFSSELDLGSSEKSINASSLPGFAPTNITVDGQSLSVTGNTMLTPAQAVAVLQVLTSGQQNITLGQSSIAVGGNFHLNNTVSALGTSGLVIPTGVTGLLDFSNSAQFQTNGALSNFGSLIGVSTNQNQMSGTISASNIINGATGIISTVLPANLQASFGLTNAISSLNLSLISSSNILNLGSIASSGNLSLISSGAITNAGTISAANNISMIMNTGNLVNSGLINSIAGNLNIATMLPVNLQINNVMGTLSALNGEINLRDSLFSAKESLSVLGGEIVSQVLNVNNGNGIANIHPNILNALMNVSTGELHTSVSEGTLNLGNVVVLGDPTIYNTNGSVFLNGNMNVNDRLTVVASGDVIALAGTSSIQTNGNDILLVAGADFSVSGGVATIRGGTIAGGNIDLTPVNLLSSASASGAGGAIRLVAFGGECPDCGRVILPTTSTITSSGAAGFASGNVLVMSGGIPASVGANYAIQVGDIVTTGGSNGSGSISIATATPSLATPVVITNGAISSGSFGTGTIQATNVFTKNLISDGGLISLDVGANLLAFGDISSVGQGAGAGGTVSIKTGSNTALTVGSSFNNLNGVSGVINRGISGGAAASAILNSATGGITISDAADIQAFAGAGAGGSLTLLSSGGTVSIPSLSRDAVGAGNFKGGSILIDSLSLVSTDPASLRLVATGVNGGAGGTVSVRTSSYAGATPTLLFSASGGANGSGGRVDSKLLFNSSLDLNLHANGLGSGKGGDIVVDFGGFATQAGSQLIASAIGGNTGGGGTILISNASGISGALLANADAGSAGAGAGGSATLAVDGDIQAAGTSLRLSAVGGDAGSGGSVGLRANDITAQSVLLQASAGANGGNGGSIDYFIRSVDSSTFNAIASAPNGNGGRIGSLSAPLPVPAIITGNFTQGFGVANFIATGGLKGGQVNLQFGNDVTGTALFVDTQSGSGNGGGATVAVGGQLSTSNVSVNTNGANDAGALNLTITGARTGSSTVLSANGVAGKGGAVTYSSASVSSPIEFRASADGGNSGGTASVTTGALRADLTSLTANSSAGTGGTVTLNATGNVRAQTSLTLSANGEVGGTINSTLGPASTTHILGATAASAVGASGNGGVVNLTVLGNLSAPFGKGLNADASGDSNGGTATVKFDSATTSNISGAVNVNVSGANGNGGTANVSSTSDVLTLNGLTINANGAAGASGGNAFLKTSGTGLQTLGVSDLQASGGSGGSVRFEVANFNANGSTTLTSNAISDGSKAGTIDIVLSKANALNVVQAKASNTSASTGDGGTVNVTVDAGFAINVDNTSGDRLELEANAGTLEGNAGTVDLKTNSQVNYNSSGLRLAAGTDVGNGGILSIVTSIDPMVPPAAALALFDPLLLNGGLNGSGGRLTVRAGSLVDASGGTGIVVNADANQTVNGTGAGGNIDIEVGGGDFNIASGSQEYYARGAGSSGDGGRIRLATVAGVVNIDPAFIQSQPTGSTGSGANYDLSGLALTVSGDMEAQGRGDGVAGGSIRLSAFNSFVRTDGSLNAAAYVDSSGFNLTGRGGTVYVYNNFTFGDTFQVGQILSWDPTTPPSTPIPAGLPGINGTVAADNVEIINNGGSITVSDNQYLQAGQTLTFRAPNNNLDLYANSLGQVIVPLTDPVLGPQAPALTIEAGALRVFHRSSPTLELPALGTSAVNVGTIEIFYENGGGGPDPTPPLILSADGPNGGVLTVNLNSINIGSGSGQVILYARGLGSNPGEGHGGTINLTINDPLFIPDNIVVDAGPNLLSGLAVNGGTYNVKSSNGSVTIGSFGSGVGFHADGANGGNGGTISLDASNGLFVDGDLSASSAGGDGGRIGFIDRSSNGLTVGQGVTGASYVTGRLNVDGNFATGFVSISALGAINLDNPDNVFGTNQIGKIYIGTADLSNPLDPDSSYFNNPTSPITIDDTIGPVSLRASNVELRGTDISTVNQSGPISLEASDSLRIYTNGETISIDGLSGINHFVVPNFVGGIRLDSFGGDVYVLPSAINNGNPTGNLDIDSSTATIDGSFVSSGGTYFTNLTVNGDWTTDYVYMRGNAYITGNLKSNWVFDAASCCHVGSSFKVDFTITSANLLLSDYESITIGGGISGSRAPNFTHMWFGRQGQVNLAGNENINIAGDVTYTASALEANSNFTEFILLEGSNVNVSGDIKFLVDNGTERGLNPLDIKPSIEIKPYLQNASILQVGGSILAEGDNVNPGSVKIAVSGSELYVGGLGSDSYIAGKITVDGASAGAATLNISNDIGNVIIDSGSALDFSSTSAAGAQLTITTSSFGSTSLGGGLYDLSGTSGGQLKIDTGSFSSLDSSQESIFDLSGSSGAGGQIDIVARSTDLSLGQNSTYALNSSFDARGGNGGALVTLVSPGVANIDLGAFNLSTNTGAGAQFKLTAPLDINLDRTLKVNGGSNGSGGQIEIQSSNSYVNISGALEAKGGTSGGSGGKVTVSSNGNLAIVGGVNAAGTAGGGANITLTSDSGAIDVGVGIDGGSGTGGSAVTLKALNDITVNGVIRTSSLVSGGGGSINVSSTSAFGPVTFHAAGLAANAAGSGSGGQILVANSITNVDIGASGISANSVSGNAGSVDIKLPGLIAVSGAVEAKSQSGAGAGGSVFMQGSAVTSGAIDVSAGGSGSGGTINLSGASGVTVNGSMKANTQTKGGDIIVQTNGALRVTGDVFAHGSSSSGGQITLNSLGTVPGSVYQISGSVAADGATGGKINLASAGSQMIIGGSSALSDYISGSVSAVGSTGAGGNIVINNTLAGPTNLSLLSTVTVAGAAGNDGLITFSNAGDFTLVGGVNGRTVGRVALSSPQNIDAQFVAANYQLKLQSATSSNLILKNTGAGSSILVSGTVDASNTLDIQAPIIVNSSGALINAGGGTGTVTATTLTNSGTIRSAGLLTVAAPTLTNFGTLQSTGANTSINTTTFNNDGVVRSIPGGTINITNSTTNPLAITGTGSLVSGFLSISSNGALNFNQQFALGSIDVMAAGNIGISIAQCVLNIAPGSSGGLTSTSGNIVVSSGGRGLSVVDGTKISAGGNISLTSQRGITFGNGVTLQAGKVSGSAVVDPLNPAFLPAGSVTQAGEIYVDNYLNGNSTGSPITVGTNFAATTYGGNNTYLTRGDLIFGDGANLQSWGGNTILSAGNGVNLGNGSRVLSSAQLTGGIHPISTPAGYGIPNYAGGAVGIFAGLENLNINSTLNTRSLTRNGVNSAFILDGNPMGGDFEKTSNVFPPPEPPPLPPDYYIQNESLTNGNTIVQVIDGGQIYQGNMLNALKPAINITNSSYESRGGVLVIDPPGPLNIIAANNAFFIAVAPGLVPLPPDAPVVLPIVAVVPGDVKPVILNAGTPQSAPFSLLPTDLVNYYVSLGVEGCEVCEILDLTNTNDGKVREVAGRCQTVKIERRDDLLITGMGGTKISMDGDKLNLKEGHILVATKDQPLTVVRSVGAVIIPPNSISVVDGKSNGTTRVSNLFGGNVVVLVGKNNDKRPTLTAGVSEEVVIANEDEEEEELIPTDGVDRISVTGTIAIAHMKTQKNRFDPQEMAQKDPILKPCLICSESEKRMANVLKKIFGETQQANANGNPQILKGNPPKHSSSLPPSSLPSDLRPINYSSVLDSESEQAVTPGHTRFGNGDVSNNLIALNRSESQMLKNQLQSVAVGDAVVKHCGALVSTNKAMTMLRDGDALITAGAEQTFVKAGKYPVTASKGAIVSISIRDDITAVRNMFDTGLGTVKILVGRTYLTIPAGTEVVIGPSKKALLEAMADDYIARRNLKDAAISAKQHIATSEFSLISLAQDSDVLTRVFKCATAEDKAIYDKVSKMSVCLSLVTGAHGAYKRVNP